MSVLSSFREGSTSQTPGRGERRRGQRAPGPGGLRSAREGPPGGSGQWEPPSALTQGGFRARCSQEGACTGRGVRPRARSRGGGRGEGRAPTQGASGADVKRPVWTGQAECLVRAAGWNVDSDNTAACDTCVLLTFPAHSHTHPSGLRPPWGEGPAIPMGEMVPTGTQEMGVLSAALTDRCRDSLP